MPQTLSPYPNYKPSGIDWIGDIPEGWDLKKVSWSFSTIGSGTTPTADRKEYYENGTVNWLNTGDLNDGFIYETNKKINEETPKLFSSLKTYPPESLVIAMYGATIGKIGLLKIETTVNQACCVLAKSDIFDIKYVFYWFLGNKQNIVNMSSGGGQPNISQEIVRNLRLTHPPQTTQTQIADYLDDKTGKIDDLIAKKKQMISLLKEERQAVINQAVTKGIDPNAKMKNSDIDWIGEIPDAWSVKKLKYAVTNIISKTKHEIKNLNPVMLENIQSYTGQIIPNSDSRVVEGDLLEFQIDDILFSKLRPYLAKVSLAKEVNSCSGELLVLRPAREFNPKFLFWRLISSDFINLVDSSTYGTKMPRASWSDFISEIKFGKPTSLEEQIKIVEYIEQKTGKIDETVSKIEKEISLLQEYRTALISEVVTGKVRVEG